eukprot:scaffold22842_cov65-Phaeocystis_antarctica.AAC.6
MRRCADNSSPALARNSRFCPSPPSSRPAVSSIAIGCPATSRNSVASTRSDAGNDNGGWRSSAAIAVAKSAQRSLEQWKKKLDGVHVRYNGVTIALLASAAVHDQLRCHLQHPSAQLQRELGVGWPVWWRFAFAYLPELRLHTVCAGIEEQINHVASFFRSLLCHCVVFDEREKPLVAAICCQPLD